MNDFVEILKSILSSLVSLIVVLTALKKFGQRFFDGEWLDTMQRQGVQVKAFHAKLFEEEFKLLDDTHERGRRMSDEFAAHRNEFREFRREIAAHMEILITIPGAVTRLTASLDRFDNMVEGLVGKVQNHEVAIATLQARQEVPTRRRGV